MPLAGRALLTAPENAVQSGVMVTRLPPLFANWFAARGWTPHAHQLALLKAADDAQSALLIAPTGGGKTLAGFLPSLVDLTRGRAGERHAGECHAEAAPPEGLHTLYVSPLKALAVDIQRNLMTPVREMGLTLAIETRTGDTPQGKRLRQRSRPPHILLTTPESLALLLSYHDAPQIFGGLKCIVIDELHALAFGKRGDLLALGLTRLATLAPGLRRVGLSATVHDPAALTAWLSPTGRATNAPVTRVIGRGGVAPELDILVTKAHLPWSGHMAVHALPEVYQHIRRHRTTLVFVNTRAQAELAFQELWRVNDDNLPIALHHGSLAIEQRRKVEAAMARGALRAVVATSSLDLGIDWAAVDLVVQVGAPKGISRLLQRLGRANHRLDQPSRALLVPANRFEVLECRAAIDGVRARTLDGDPPRPGGLDVLIQHILGRACCGPFHADALYQEVTLAGPYADLKRADFDNALDFVVCGGYALRSYEKYRRLSRDKQGRWKISNPRHILRYRLNMGVRCSSRTDASWARWRRSSSKGCCPATPLSSPASCCAMSPAGKPPPMSAGPPGARTPRYRPMGADGCRFPPIWPSGCARCWSSRRRGTAFPPPWRTGCANSAAAQCCRRKPDCWWRPFPEAASSSWWPTALPGATRTKRWGCC